MCVYSVLLWLPPVFKCCYLGVSSALLPRCRWGATAPRPQWAGSSVMCCLRSRTSLWVLSSSSSMQWAPPLLCDPANKGKHTWNKSSLPFIIINVSLFKMLQLLFWTCQHYKVSLQCQSIVTGSFTLAHWWVLWYLNIKETPILPKRPQTRLFSSLFWNTVGKKHTSHERRLIQLFKVRWCICYLCEQRQRRAATACLCFRTAARWRCGHWCDPSGWAGGWIGRWTWKHPPCPSSPHAWYKAAKDIDDLRGESLWKSWQMLFCKRGEGDQPRFLQWREPISCSPEKIQLRKPFLKDEEKNTELVSPQSEQSKSKLHDFGTSVRN